MQSIQDSWICFTNGEVEDVHKITKRWKTSQVFCCYVIHLYPFISISISSLKHIHSILSPSLWPMISPKHLDMLSLSWDPRPNVTLQWIQLVKKNKAQTPDICYSCRWRKDGAGSKGKQHQILKCFQVQTISFKCPAPRTSPHIFCGWHSHHTPLCHQPEL